RVMIGSPGSSRSTMNTRREVAISITMLIATLLRMNRVKSALQRRRLEVQLTAAFNPDSGQGTVRSRYDCRLERNDQRNLLVDDRLHGGPVILACVRVRRSERRREGVEEVLVHPVALTTTREVEVERVGGLRRSRLEVRHNHAGVRLTC